MPEESSTLAFFPFPVRDTISYHSPSFSCTWMCYFSLYLFVHCRNESLYLNPASKNRMSSYLPRHSHTFKMLWLKSTSFIELVDKSGEFKNQGQMGCSVVVHFKRTHTGTFTRGNPIIHLSRTDSSVSVGSIRGHQGRIQSSGAFKDHCIFGFTRRLINAARWQK